VSATSLYPHRPAKTHTRPRGQRRQAAQARALKNNGREAFVVGCVEEVGERAGGVGERSFKKASAGLARNAGSYVVGQVRVGVSLGTSVRCVSVSPVAAAAYQVSRPLGRHSLRQAVAGSGVCT
jgi:hypothetical protein